MIRPAGAAVLWLAVGVPVDAGELDRLLTAYPDHLAAIAAGDLVWRDGTRMPTGEGGPARSDEDALEAPTIADILRQPYPAGEPQAVPTTDPGRFRPAAFFEKMYGRCSPGSAAPAGFGAVTWLRRHGGGSLRVTRVNGVDLHLQAVSDELDALPAEFLVYLKPAAGTYNCRPIAGTHQASAHGYGIAIDIATARADYWRWSRSGYRSRIPPEIVAVFERHGFIWGGRWAHFDTMHFEYRPEMLAR